MELYTAIIYYSMRSYLEAKEIEKEQAKKAKKAKKTKNAKHVVTESVLPDSSGRLIAALNLDTPSCRYMLRMGGVLCER